MDSWIFVAKPPQYSFDLTYLLHNEKKFKGDFLQLNEFVNKDGIGSIFKTTEKGTFSFPAFKNVSMDLCFFQLSGIADAVLRGELPSKEFMNFLEGKEVRFVLEWSFRFDKFVIPNQQVAKLAAKLLVCNNGRYFSASMEKSLEKYVEFSIDEDSVKVVDFKIGTFTKFGIEFCCSFRLKNKSRDLYCDLENGPLAFGNEHTQSYFDVAKTLINHAESIYLYAGRSDFFFEDDASRYIALRPINQEQADVLFKKDYDIFSGDASKTTRELMDVIDSYYPEWKPKKISFLPRHIHLNGTGERGIHFGLNWKAIEIYDSKYISRIESILALVESVKKNKDGFYLDTKIVEKRSISIRLEKSEMIPELYERGFEDPDFLKNQKRIEKYLVNLKQILNALLKFSREVVYDGGRQHSFASLVETAVKQDPLAFINNASIPVANYAKSLLNGSFYGDTSVNNDLEIFFG